MLRKQEAFLGRIVYFMDSVHRYQVGKQFTLAASRSLKEASNADMAGGGRGHPNAEVDI